MVWMISTAVHKPAHLLPIGVMFGRKGTLPVNLNADNQLAGKNPTPIILGIEAEVMSLEKL